MPANLQNHTNALVDHNLQEGMMKMKIEKKEKFDESIVYPYRPGEPDCMFYLRNGRCNYGINCRFNHPRFPQNNECKKELLPQREGQPDCGFFLKTGSCKYGACCKYHHPPDRRGAEALSLNSCGLPLRKEEKACLFYLKFQTCKFGTACKFDHPEPTSVEKAASLPAAVPRAAKTTTPATVGTGAFLPSPGMPYAGSLPTWPWTGSSYYPGQPSYMPYFMPALQGAVATSNWNGYLGNSSVVGTDAFNTSKNQGELPQRPDQPECRYFMSNGGCKYGSDCKFHHPKEKIAHSFGPHGFPLRPGEAVCPNFSSYGICKNGPTCKFNHPIAGYFPGYYFGMPLVPTLNQPYIPSRRNVSISSINETSQSKSLKITDWIQKPETRQDCGPKPGEDSPEDAHSNAAAAEILQDHSD